jgi:hypothetical protein
MPTKDSRKQEAQGAHWLSYIHVYVQPQYQDDVLWLHLFDGWFLLKGTAQRESHARQALPHPHTLC